MHRLINNINMLLLMSITYHCLLQTLQVVFRLLSLFIGEPERGTSAQVQCYHGHIRAAGRRVGPVIRRLHELLEPPLLLLFLRLQLGVVGVHLLLLQLQALVQTGGGTHTHVRHTSLQTAIHRVDFIKSTQVILVIKIHAYELHVNGLYGIISGTCWSVLQNVFPKLNLRNS